MTSAKICEVCANPVRKERHRYCSVACTDEAKRLPIGTIRIRRGPAGYMRTWVKCGDRLWKLRSHVVWEETHGPIPPRHVVHHIDDDTLNDDISNLQAVTRPQHVRAHRPWFVGNDARDAALRGWQTRRRNATVS